MTPPAQQRNVFVLGGGVAGLVAAFGLADRGFRVTLLESRGWLGGRAFSALDRETGRRLDNGPHVMLGCYSAMRSLLRRLGTERHFLGERRLAMAYRTTDGRLRRLRLSRWPVPMSMPWALLRLGLGFGTWCRALLGMAGVVRGAPPSWSLDHWLERRRQTGAPDDFLWRPLCRAIMNTEPSDAAAADYLAVLREAFLGRASAAAFWLPQRSWGEILADAAPSALRAAGVSVRSGARVAGFGTAGSRVDAIDLADGQRLSVASTDLVVSALPWFALRKLVPASVAAFGGLRSSPIVSAFVETAAGAPALPDDGPVVVLVGGEPFHFVLRTPGAEQRQFALLSGGNRSFDGMSVDAIANAAIGQLHRYYASVPMAGATVRIRKEQHATFVSAPGSSAVRPAPGRLAGGPENLLVCGDWTATGLPSTLEGAARSAEAVLRAI
ncbi:MAG TPA: FAD-dependent oxidoreductase [Planctomycetota bacterium]